MCRIPLVVTILACMAPQLQASATFRLYDGITAYVPNPEGKDFTLKLDVRDLNLVETGPREVLLKIYDPAGKAVVRTVIPDDGVVSKAFLPPAGAWDHEAWYYAFCRIQGTQPMLRWSAFSAPDRFAAVPKRTFTYEVKGGQSGIYRIQIVGMSEHYVTLTLDPDLAFAVAGHPTWLHGSSMGDVPGKGSRRFIYVPRGTVGLNLVLAEFDLPHSRRFTLAAPDGNKLFDDVLTNGYVTKPIDFSKPGVYDDQLLMLDVSAGPDDYLVNIKLVRAKDPEVSQRLVPAVAAVYAPDEKTARTIQGGAIYHDQRVFWHPFQIRLYDWLKKQPAEEFVVKDPSGKELVLKKGKDKDWIYDGFPTRPGFLNVNDLYWGAPPCDGLMHHYPAHKNRQILNVAIRDLNSALRSIGPGEIPGVFISTSTPWANMAYEYSNYAWQYWRPAWRILQQSDAPAEVKEIIQDAFLLCGDRLAFCVSWARTNGNSFAQLVAALRYCQEATGDPLHRKLFDTYWQRFTTGGWGERCGIGRSGPCQESFGYDHHYGSYMLGTWKAILADLGDERFQKVYDRIRNVYSYTLNDEAATCPWSSRTDHQAHWDMEKTGPFAWKGLPGPDFTVSVNDGNEWFAARRKNYYALTYHGRITPIWVGAAFAGQIGYSGGLLCQVHVPGKGLVLASTLNGGYGEGMHPSQWRKFHLHSVVGQTADGKVLVGANSEHEDAKLVGTTLTSSGAVRDSTVSIARTYAFEDGHVQCGVKLKETGFNDLLNLWIPNAERGKLAECWEMIPFVGGRRAKKGDKGKLLTYLLKGEEVEAEKARKGEGEKGSKAEVMKGKKAPPVIETEEAICDTIVIDRGGFGVRIELDQPRRVQRGQNNTLLISLIQGPTPASKVGASYRIVPFGGP